MSVGTGTATEWTAAVSESGVTDDDPIDDELS
jgi:hypothetical protein